MVYIVASHLAWFPSIVGFGILILRLLRKPSKAADPSLLLLATLLGMATLGTIANLLNLFVPISPTLAFLLLLAGWGLLIVFRGYLHDVLSATWHHGSWSLGLLLLLLFLWGAFLSRQARDLPHDTGLYHLQAIKWVTQSQLPLGLANLHGRFGFNSLWFTVAAALEVPWLEGKSAFIVNALPFALYGSTICAALLHACKSGLRFSSAFLISSAIAWISMSREDFTRDATVGSPAPDLPVALLILISTYMSIKAIESKDELAYYIGAGFVLAIFSITIKLSSLPILAGPIVALCWLHYRESHHSGWSISHFGKAMLPSLVIGLCLLVPWVLRGVMLSGCLAYPAPFGRIPMLEWAVPTSQIESERMWIMSWARQPGASPDMVLSSWGWLSPWLSKLSSTWTAKQMAFLLLIAGLLWVVARKRNPRPDETESYCIPAIAPFIGIGYWFVTAPDLRFGQGFIWSLVLLVFSSGVFRVWNAYRLFGRKQEKASLLLSAVTVIVLARFASITFFEPPRPGMMYSWPEVPTVPADKVQAQTTKEGVLLFTPGSGGQCWNHDIPCAPSVDPNLEVLSDDFGQPRLFKPAREK